VLLLYFGIYGIRAEMLHLLQAAQVRFIRDKTIFSQQLDAVRKSIGDKNVSRAQLFYDLTLQSHKVCCS